MKKTIKDALEYVKEQMVQPYAIGPTLALIMIDEIIKELSKGKTIDDYIEFK